MSDFTYYNTYSITSLKDIINKIQWVLDYYILPGNIKNLTINETVLK